MPRGLAPNIEHNFHQRIAVVGFIFSQACFKCSLGHLADQQPYCDIFSKGFFIAFSKWGLLIHTGFSWMSTSLDKYWGIWQIFASKLTDVCLVGATCVSIDKFHCIVMFDGPLLLNRGLCSPNTHQNYTLRKDITHACHNNVISKYLHFTFMPIWHKRSLHDYWFCTYVLTRLGISWSKLWVVYCEENHIHVGQLHICIYMKSAMQTSPTGTRYCLNIV